jgi:hypothetical protein
MILSTIQSFWGCILCLPLRTTGILRPFEALPVRFQTRYGITVGKLRCRIFRTWEIRFRGLELIIYFRNMILSRHVLLGFNVGGSGVWSNAFLTLSCSCAKLSSPAASGGLTSSSSLTQSMGLSVAHVRTTTFPGTADVIILFFCAGCVLSCPAAGVTLT